MNATLTKNKWFWPWQDDKEEAWLESMALSGWHLRTAGLLGHYTFDQGEARPYTYRLDYMPVNKDRLPDYLQIFQDAGWEYIGEMANWRYWRKPVAPGETQEIFTDNESKIKKYQRLLYWMGIMLLLMVILGRELLTHFLEYSGVTSLVEAIYFLAGLLYALIIPIYVVVVVKLFLRVKQLKKEAL